LQECSHQLLLASFGEQAELEKEVRTAESAANKVDFDPIVRLLCSLNI